MNIANFTVSYIVFKFYFRLFYGLSCTYYDVYWWSYGIDMFYILWAITPLWIWRTQNKLNWAESPVALEGGMWSLSRPVHFIPRKETWCTLQSSLKRLVNFIIPQAVTCRIFYSAYRIIFIHSFIHLVHIPLILYRCGTSHLYI